MYVCLCAGVTDTQIRKAVSEGCCSVKALRDELGVGVGCGKCVKVAKHIIQATLAGMPAITSDKAA